MKHNIQNKYALLTDHRKKHLFFKKQQRKKPTKSLMSFHCLNNHHIGLRNVKDGLNK